MSKINFQQVIANTPELEKIECPLKIAMVNVVGTVELLNPGETLCLYSLALQLPGMTKFVPTRFAAAVMRIKDAIGTTTCLVFRPGTILVVGALTRYHSLHASHLYRKSIEKTRSLYREDNGQLGLFSLVNRTIFRNWTVSNMVAHDTLPNLPNLYEIAQAASDVAVWTPELFPGLILLVWLSPKANCKCKNVKRTGSCNCNARVLIFDSGQIVIMGCKTMEAIHRTRRLIFDFLSDAEFQDQSGVLVPKHLRFEARRRKCLGIIDFSGWKRRGTEPPRIESLWDDLLSNVSFKSVVRMQPPDDDPTESPYRKARRLNQTENVATIASFSERNSP